MDSCHASGQVGQQADKSDQWGTELATRNAMCIQIPGTYSRLPPAQTSEVMEPAGQDHQTGRVCSQHRRLDHAGSINLTHMLVRATGPGQLSHCRDHHQSQTEQPPVQYL